MSGLSATAKVTASEGAVYPGRANDQFEPESSDDAASYMHWWPKKGTAEWLEYGFDAPVRVAEIIRLLVRRYRRRQMPRARLVAHPL